MPFVTMSSWVLSGDLKMGVLDGENAWVGPDGIGPKHVANGVKGVREDSLQCHYVLDYGCGTRSSHLSQLYLEGRFEGDDSLGE